MRSLIVSCVVIAVVVSVWLIFVNYDRLSDQWHDHKKIYTFFFNTSEILDTVYAIARAKYYIKSEDVALSAGELNMAREQLKFLHLNELITLDNIF